MIRFFECLIIFCFLFKIKSSHGQSCVGNLYNDKQPTETSKCMVWGDYNVKTFDDHGFSFRTGCSITLVSFELGNDEFRIDIGKVNETCTREKCYTFVEVLYNGQTYRLGRDDLNFLTFSTGKGSYSIPVELPGISVTQPGTRMIVDFTRIGVDIKWNEKNMIEISIENGEGYEILGLCGNNDKCSSNDQLSRRNTAITDFDLFLDEWKTSSTCANAINTYPICNGNTFDLRKAETACQILKDARFKEANEMLNPQLYIDACIWNYCSCPTKHADCLCETLDVYAEASTSAGVADVSWKCGDKQCDIWGDSHVNTFDGLRYDFQGECSYTLVKGKMQEDDFRIDVSNEICSHEGATCLKSFTININMDGVKESITITKKGELPDTRKLTKLILKDNTLFVTVYVLGTGIEIFWDTRTWIYVKLDKKWQKGISGLCGNFNQHKDDDLEVSGTRINEKEAYHFVDLWKLDDKCEMTKLNENVCDDKRKTWAERQCHILLDKVFSPCHKILPVDDYYQACVMDSCKCDLGGDCECLCTAIATYAQHCNNYGVPVKWRNQSVCPIQCFGNTRYEPCMSTCPVKTCEVLQKNLTTNCEEETCVEGCAPKTLAPGRVYTDITYEKSVLESACGQPQCELDGVLYYHHETILETDCGRCYCFSGNKVCMNLPTCEVTDDSKTTTIIPGTLNPRTIRPEELWTTTISVVTDLFETTTSAPTAECVYTCPPGYGVNGTACLDIDECSQFNPCGPLVECSNKQPGYECGSCRAGYRGNYTKYFNEFVPENIPEDICLDINECEERIFKCPDNAICRNTEGSYKCLECGSHAVPSDVSDTCVCEAGWSGDGQICSDIDECALNNDDCPSDKLCINTEGSYKCVKCDSNARPWGIHEKCVCNTGWAGDGTVCGIDTDMDSWPDNDLGCSGKKCRKDNCQTKPNSGQEDYDSDGTGDRCESDADNDGVLNTDDNCPSIPNGDRQDSDSDGLGDVCDNCPYNSNMNQADVDNDNIGDVCDTDIDGDGLQNTADNCPSKPNPDQLDRDGDGIGDVCDNCPATYNPGQEDKDEDFAGDACDSGTDVDGDGIKDNVDNCRDISNSDQSDLDNDGKGDVCDEDMDNDGILNINDNCIMIYNPDQKNSDNKGRGDACEKDADGDGVLDELDNCPKNYLVSKTDFRSFKEVIFHSQLMARYHIYNQGAEITQTVWTFANLAVGSDRFGNVDYEGTVFVDTNEYGNPIGIIFGYQSNRKFYAVTWRKNPSGYSETVSGYQYVRSGVQIKLFNSATGPNVELNNALWYAGETPNETTTLWEDPNKFKWQELTSYRWKLIHRPTLGLINLKIWSGTNLVVDSGYIFDKTLTGGRLGVCSYAQPNVIWSNLQYKCADYDPRTSDGSTEEY